MYKLIVKKNSKNWTISFKGNECAHRRKGSAIEYQNGNKSFYLYGINYQKEIINGDEFTYCFYHTTGKSLNSWLKEPAVIYKNGTKEWYSKNLLHRYPSPAIEYSNGDKEYWFQGKRHRADGPAVIIGNKQYWYKRGKFVKYSESPLSITQLHY